MTSWIFLLIYLLFTGVLAAVFIQVPALAPLMTAPSAVDQVLLGLGALGVALTVYHMAFSKRTNGQIKIWRYQGQVEAVHFFARAALLIGWVASLWQAVFVTPLDMNGLIPALKGFVIYGVLLVGIVLLRQTHLRDLASEEAEPAESSRAPRRQTAGRSKQEPRLD